MSIRISIYDFFAYTIPGGVYFFIAIYTLSQLGVLNLDLLTFNPSFFHLVIIAGMAYILGMLMEPIAKVWYNLFKPKNLPEKVLKGFQENRPHIEVKFRATDWPILMAYIRREDMEMAEYIERDNASNLMLRSLSFALLIFGIVQIVQFAITLYWIYLIAALICLLFSAIALKFSLKFATWFYLLIYEATTARVLPGLDRVTWRDKPNESKQSQDMAASK